MTEREAIDKTIELWVFLAETGKMKEDWPGWKEYGGIDDFGECAKIKNLCFLCELTTVICERCPYAKKFGDCVEDNSVWGKWCLASQVRTRKKYAALFLEQMKQLREVK